MDGSNVKPLERLRVLVETGDPDGTVTIRWLGQLLEEGQEPSAPAGQDLTVEQVAEAVQKSASTVRGWLSSGLIPGAYKLRGKSWRVPPAALAEFRKREAASGEIASDDDEDVDLGAWRRTG